MKKAIASPFKPLGCSRRLWKILTCSAVLVGIAFLPLCGLAQTPVKELSLQLGNYDFTDKVANDFYHRAPSFRAGLDIWKREHLSFVLTSGASISAIRYNGSRHRFLIVPLSLMSVYRFREEDTSIRPYFGSGVGLYYKSDRNNTLKKTHYFFTYGYLLNCGLDFPVKNGWTFSVEVKYNFVVPSAKEATNIDGILSTVGLRIPLTQRKGIQASYRL